MHKEIKNFNIMGIFYKVSDQQLLKDRNDLFKEVGISSLENRGFVKRPFKTSWFGEYYADIQGYVYEFSRFETTKYLEIIEVYITKSDKYIHINLCIFEINSNINYYKKLIEKDGILFGMTVENKEKYIQLRVDDYKSPPIVHTFSPEHRIGSYYTENGYKKELKKLKSLIQKDMQNIDHFVKRWHELHKPNITDWEGNVIEKR